MSYVLWYYDNWNCVPKSTKCATDINYNAPPDSTLASTLQTSSLRVRLEVYRYWRRGYGLCLRQKLLLLCFTGCQRGLRLIWIQNTKFSENTSAFLQRFSANEHIHNSDWFVRINNNVLLARPRGKKKPRLKCAAANIRLLRVADVRQTPILASATPSVISGA